MLEIEKRLAQADLSQFKEIPDKIFAKHCIEYQNFKTSAALKHINTFNLSDTTAKLYFEGVNVYLRTGKVIKGLSSSVKKYVDEFLQNKRYTVRIPNADEQRRVYNYKKHTMPKDEICIPIKRKELHPAIEEFVYGCLVDDCIYTFKSERELTAFNKGVLLSDKDFKIMHLNKEFLQGCCV